MNRPYLVICNAGYYPRSGTDDWLGCFSTEKEAEDFIKEHKERNTYNGHYDLLYEIVDLTNWVN